MDKLKIRKKASPPKGAMDKLKIRRKGSPPKGDMYRVDGSKKSNTGYLGQIKNKVDGGVMTEVSLQFRDFNGRKPIPALVPTLTKQEIQQLQNMKIKGNADKIPQSIKRKAVEHARIRLHNGLNPFYQDGE